ncbi:MAG: zinc ribbon domain-containing protein [Promethearchaeota archaeon]|jgi:hypothetical protein
MVSSRNIWALPLIGGIFVLIAIFTPTAYFTFSSGLLRYDEYSWMWGLLYAEISDYEFMDFYSDIEFVSFAPEIFIPGLITTLLLSIGAISNIITAYNYRRERRTFGEVKKKWIITGSLHIISAIVYLSGMEIGFRAYRQRTIGVPISFWGDRVPHFGIIVPIIGGILVLVGTFLGVRSPQQEDVIMPVDQVRIKPKMATISNVISPSKTPGKTPAYNFCPSCGHKNTVENSKFCVNCGFAYKPK